jgi:hypothetical protein
VTRLSLLVDCLGVALARLQGPGHLRPGDKDKAKVDKEDDVSGCEKVKVKK